MRFLFLYSIVFLFSSNVIFSQTKVAVIGGGIAGVSAAHYIHQYDKNVEITLFEKELVLGGNAQTVEVTTTAGTKCMVDVGPQYFTKGPWDDYIQFLDETIGFETILTESMAGTLLIQRKNEINPLVVTPLNGKFRGEKLGNLLKLKKFNTEAYKVYKNPTKWNGKSVQEWVETLHFTEQYKTEIIYPFLAASLGTTVSDIKKTAVFEIVSLFAFRKPKAKNSFSIVEKGMGGLIQQIGEKLKQSGVIIKTDTPVYSVRKEEKGYTIAYIDGGKASLKNFDFVVMAVHADVAATLLKDDSSLQQTSDLLTQFPYFEAHIVVHQDTNYINTQKPAFLNIYTNQENQLTFSTMNLSLISPRLQGVYKSWMSEEDRKRVKDRGLFLHETTFYHPLITTEFVANLKKLKEISQQLSGICIIGGWTEGLETQNSAVVSAKRALEAFKLYQNQ